MHLDMLIQLISMYFIYTGIVLYILGILPYNPLFKLNML